MRPFAKRVEAIFVFAGRTRWMTIVLSYSPVTLSLNFQARLFISDDFITQQNILRWQIGGERIGHNDA